MKNTLINNVVVNDVCRVEMNSGLLGAGILIGNKKRRDIDFSPFLLFRVEAFGEECPQVVLRGRRGRYG